MLFFRSKQFLLFSIFLVLVSFFTACKSKQKIRVLQFNIWQEGTVVPNGFKAIVDEIVAAKADLVAFSEVRNYHKTDFSKRIIAELAKRGMRYYGGKSYDSGLISRFPIKEYKALYPVKEDHGSITKALINVNGITVAFYSAHLDYLNCSYYMPRGYDGSTWRELSSPETNIDTLLKIGYRSMRDDAVKVFITDAKQEIAHGNHVIIGGDFNEPSHRDWGKEMAALYDHNGVVINWTCTTLLEEVGLVDVYREIYPNPVKNPGFTYPSANKDIPIQKLTWAPKADERERIDFIFFYPNKHLKITDAVIVGVDSSICRSKVVKETTDKFIKPQGVWPSDHKAVLAVFELAK